MKLLTKTFALALFSLPLLANAAGKTNSATMQVSFEVKESCNVQSSAAATATTKAAATPAVSCQLNTPYQLARNSDTASTSNNAQNTAIRQENATGDWTITF